MFGNNTLIGSTIKSTNRGTAMFISINGTNDNNFNIYCNKNDNCYIDCQSKESCINLNLYCNGICFVSCNCSHINGYEGMMYDCMMHEV